MSSTHTTLSYKDVTGKEYEGDLYIPSDKSGAKLPTVVVFPAFRGITEFEKERAKELAEKHGYIALAADLYGKGIRLTVREEAFAVLRAIIADRVGTLKPRLEAVMTAIKTVPQVDHNKISAIGYCFGGLCSLDVARYHLGIKAAVSFHGTLTPVPDIPLDSIINCAIQVHHGDADPHINKEQVDNFHVEMRTRNADFVFVSHAHAEHSFTEPEADSFNTPGVKYNEKAAKRSWRATVALLNEVYNGL